MKQLEAFASPRSCNVSGRDRSWWNTRAGRGGRKGRKGTYRENITCSKRAQMVDVDSVVMVQKDFES